MASAAGEFTELSTEGFKSYATEWALDNIPAPTSEYNRRAADRKARDTRAVREAINFTADNPGKTALVVGPNNYRQWYKNGKKVKHPDG